MYPFKGNGYEAFRVLPIYKVFATKLEYPEPMVFVLPLTSVPSRKILRVPLSTVAAI